MPDASGWCGPALGIVGAVTAWVWGVRVAQVRAAREVGDRPLLKRYLGPADVARQIMSVAKREGIGTVVAGYRDILTDLFHAGRESGLSIAGFPPWRRPAHFYEQNCALRKDVAGAIRAILGTSPSRQGLLLRRVEKLRTGGAYSGRPLAVFRPEVACARQ